MKKRLLSNWPLKILSVALAVGIWMFVISYDNPVETRRITNIPITIINDGIISQAGKSYQIEGRLFASIRVTAQRLVFSELTAADFRATADFSQIYELTNQVPVTVQSLNGKVASDQIHVETESIRLVIEDVRSQRFTIDIRTEGNPSSGYMLGESIVSPEWVTVTAPESVLAGISHAGVTVNVDGVSQRLQTTAAIEFYNHEGSVLQLSGQKDVSVSASGASVTIEVLNTKTVPVLYSVSGEAAEGYRYTDTRASHGTLLISGLRSTMAGVSAVTIPAEALSVQGAVENKVVTIDVRQYLPEGVSLVNESDCFLEFTMIVEPLETDIHVLPATRLVLEGGSEEYAYHIKGDGIAIAVRGLRADLNQLSLEEITLSADVTGLAPGEYTIPVVVSLPAEGYSLAEPIEVQLVIETIEESTDAGETEPESEDSTSHA